MGNSISPPHLGLTHLGAVVPFLSIIAILLMAIGCTPSSLAPTTTVLPTADSTLALSPPTPDSTPDLERESIISFTLQALEIEAKRNDLTAYLAGLANSVGGYGQALAIERFFSRGVPSALRDAPLSGYEGMASLRNKLLLLDSPRSVQVIKEELLHVYNSEIQLASNQLAYPDITVDNLGYWPQLVADGGPCEHYWESLVGTAWFGLQEIRGHIYALWADTLEKHGIDPAGLTIQNAPETDIRHLQERHAAARCEAPFVTYFRVLGIATVASSEGSYHLSFSEHLSELFRWQQIIGLFTNSGIEPEPSWDAYVRLFGGEIKKKDEEAARILRALFDMTHEQRELAGLTFEPGSPGKIEELQDYIRTGLRLRRGSIGADHLAGRVPYVLTLWQLEKPQTAAGTPMPFLDYFASTFGISNLPAE